jgi:serine O-acetyltransferase
MAGHYYNYKSIFPQRNNMILSKEDYRYYLEADKIGLGVRGSLNDYIENDVWRFERLLRKVEYYQNCKKSPLWKPYKIFLKLRLNSLSRSLGFTIPPNVFGPGLNIGHPGTIVINPAAKVGNNCRIHVCVTIATKAGFTDEAPRIGNNVYIGPGAKIFGPIEISDNIVIGANSVVIKSFLEPGITIAGVPAKKISAKSSEGLLRKATEIIGGSGFGKIS